MAAQQASMSEPNHLIAVVDDDQRVLNALQELLEAVGYDALAFRSARSLLDSHDIGRVTCVITDIGMPDINGFELREILCRDRPEISVILITGRYELIENLPTQNSLTMLRKPFDSSTLLSAISNSLNGTAH